MANSTASDRVYCDAGAGVSSLAISDMRGAWSDLR